MNKGLAETLTLALVNYIDENRPEGTMCCSNAECKSIEEMFEGDQLDIIEAFIQKKLSGLTEFEMGLVNFYNKRSKILPDKDGMYNRHDYEELLHESAKTLLSLAKKELLKEWNENMKDEYARGKKDGLTIGYNNGYKDAEKQYNESVAYHFPVMPQSHPFCYEPGGTCTNPQMDCINCPRRTGGGFNTSSGTSTATLHDNTSATDGKEHNQSFTD